MATRQRSHLGRLSEIAQVAARHGFGYLIDGRRRGDVADGMPTARGRHLPVKGQRPNAPATSESDIQLLDQAARLVVERVHALAFVDTRELVDEFARSIRQELDYRLEGRNADTFHHNFAGHPHVSVPKVYWSYTRPRVLTLERLEGTQLADIRVDEWSLDQRRRLAYLITE